MKNILRSVQVKGLSALLILTVTQGHASTEPLTATIDINELKNIDELPGKSQQMIATALQLAGQQIGYQYGSANPDNGGMDCSGTIHYLIKTMGVTNPPRSSQAFYEQAQAHEHFIAVKDTDLNSPEFKQLRPGDLLYWAGTYEPANGAYATHVMLYLGKDIHGQPLMFGASDGRSFNQQRMSGVSVFDFQMPKPDSSSKFIGYSCIENLNC